MKKKYEKPVIFFESFKMNANTAGSCQMQDGQFLEDTCANYMTISNHLSCELDIEMSEFEN